GQPTRGQVLAIRASDGFAEMNHRYGIAHCRLAMGRALLADGRITVAITVFEEALQSFAGCGDPWSEAYARLLLAGALRRIGPLHEVINTLVQADQGFEELGDLASRDSARALLRSVQRQQRRLGSGRGWRAAPHMARDGG